MTKKDERTEKLIEEAVGKFMKDLNVSGTWLPTIGNQIIDLVLTAIHYGIETGMAIAIEAKEDEEDESE